MAITRLKGDRSDGGRTLYGICILHTPENREMTGSYLPAIRWGARPTGADDI
ncbi:hypothetical protein [Arthrospira platensis]|uniref:hypothetical protein n=1 Tax=Limnospira platensis TaxID=118562 RepID=UPI00138FF04F